jgi:hypothetical protein
LWLYVKNKKYYCRHLVLNLAPIFNLKKKFTRFKLKKRVRRHLGFSRHFDFF